MLGIALLLPALCLAQEVAAVKSRSLRMYNQVLTGFSVEARARVQVARFEDLSGAGDCAFATRAPVAVPEMVAASLQDGLGLFLAGGLVHVAIVPRRSVLRSRHVTF